MSPEEVKRRFPNASKAFIEANASRLTAAVPDLNSTAPPTWHFVLQQSGDESKLNKLETAYLQYLRVQSDQWVGVQCITLKLGGDCRYTPDFWGFDINGLRAIDVKGKHTWEDSLIKLRVAARMFPWIRFVIAKRNGIIWEHKDVKP